MVWTVKNFAIAFFQGKQIMNFQIRYVMFISHVESIISYGRRLL